MIWRPHQDALAHRLAGHIGLVAELARDELAEVVRLTPIINGLEKRLADRVRTAAPSLLALYGCGALTAARIVGETADVARFPSEAAFARYVGLAPVPHWSGSTRGRMRSYRGGNRQLNAALHQIAMTQIKKGGPAELTTGAGAPNATSTATQSAALNAASRAPSSTGYAPTNVPRGKCWSPNWNGSTPAGPPTCLLKRLRCGAVGRQDTPSRRQPGQNRFLLR